MGGEFKEDRNTYNPSIRYIRFEVWGYEVWDRNGFLRFGMSRLSGLLVFTGGRQNART